MRLHTRQAANLADLMRAIRAEFGTAAVVLSVRRVSPEAPGTGVLLIEAAVAVPTTPGEQSVPDTGADEGRSEDRRFRDDGGRSRSRRSREDEERSSISSILSIPSAPPPERNHSAAPRNTSGAPRAAAAVTAPPASITLVGPPGSGKTTSAVKIAGQLAGAGHQVGVVSTDVARPGGAGLLLACCAELRLPVTTAATASDLQNRIARWNCRGPLVVDTRGCSPHDSLELERLGRLLDTAGLRPDRYLVLSATEHPFLIREALQAYAALNFTGIVLTRVDLATGMGHGLEEIQRQKVPLTYLGTGMEVPGNLMRPTADCLAALEPAQELNG